ncbi:MAG: SanA protein, partial [Candidatus Omnitrophota bacterium]
VPEADIILDYAGFSTLDSVVRARDVFGQDDLIIVSQQFHLERAIFIAKCKNIQVLGYVAKDPPHRRNYIKVRGRECLARVKAALDCYVLVTKPHFPGPPEPIQLQPDPGNRPSSSPNG